MTDRDDFNLPKRATADDPIPLDAKTLAAIAAAKALPDPRPASAPIGWPELFRSVANRLESRIGAPSLDGYDLVDGLRAAANLMTASDGSFVHTDDANGVPLDDARRVHLREYASPALVSASRSNTSVLDVGCIECSVGRGRPCINEDGTARDIVHDDRLKRFAFEQQRSGSATPHTRSLLTTST